MAISLQKLTTSSATKNVFISFIKPKIVNIYEKFIELVSNGRNLDQSATRTIAEGKIWTGTQAVNNGLVDQLGGLSQAIEEAANMAGLDDYQVKYFRKTILFLSGLMLGALNKLWPWQIDNENYLPYEYSNILGVDNFIEFSIILFLISFLISFLIKSVK